MFLTKEEESILEGNEGEILSKLLRLIVQLGDSYGADKLLEIKSAHTVLNFGLSFVNAAADILHQIAGAGLKVKVRTTADPILDENYKSEMDMVISLFKLQDQLLADLSKIGVDGYTCTPYYMDNKPDFGDHCAWAESSAVIYLNSVIGARSNREGGVLDIASAITGKTPNYGLHIDENRKGQILFKVALKDFNTHDLTSIGLQIGEIAGNKIPVIEGLKNISNDQIKNLGAASAASGAVALIHVLGVTPEARNVDDAFQNDKPEEIVEIDQGMLKEMREKYSTEWDASTKNIAIGCPQLSKEEVISVLKKIEGKKVREDLHIWICCCEGVKDFVYNSEYNKILNDSGMKITAACPLLAPLPRPYMTNSGKSCVYSNATYRDIDICIKTATEGN